MTMNLHRGLQTNLLLCGAEGRLLCVHLVFRGASVRVFCDVLRLLHKLCGVHGLHGDYVEGVQILQTEGFHLS